MPAHPQYFDGKLSRYHCRFDRWSASSSLSKVNVDIECYLLYLPFNWICQVLPQKEKGTFTIQTELVFNKICTNGGCILKVFLWQHSFKNHLLPCLLKIHTTGENRNLLSFQKKQKRRKKNEEMVCVWRLCAQFWLMCDWKWVIDVIFFLWQAKSKRMAYFMDALKSSMKSGYKKRAGT